MATTTTGGTYTAKLVDGPLEGKTLSAALVDGGAPQARLVIPANDRGKRYVYRRGEIAEFAAGGGAPGAVDYHYYGADFS